MRGAAVARRASADDEVSQEIMLLGDTGIARLEPTPEGAARTGLGLGAVQELAEAGDADAQYTMGMANRPGGALGANDDWAAFWLGKSAEQGLAKAQLEVGMLFLNGHGVEKNLETSASWVSAAANQGLADAQYQMGLMLLGGIGVEANGEWALYWLKQCVEQEGRRAADAYFQIGIMYQFGQGVDQHKGQANFHFELAAQLGHKEAFIACSSLARTGRFPPTPGNTPGTPAMIRRKLWGNPW